LQQPYADAAITTPGFAPGGKRLPASFR